MNYIVTENENVISCQNNIDSALAFLLDSIINKYKVYLEIIKINSNRINMPNFNLFKITCIIKIHLLSTM